jgi:hypothetical protein
MAGFLAFTRVALFLRAQKVVPPSRVKKGEKFPVPA